MGSKVIRCVLVGAAIGAFCLFGARSGRVVAPSAVKGGPREVNDLICGPRCVQFVLAHYTHDADLIELAKEIQWPNVEAGATLHDLANALSKRGVHTKPIRVNNSASPLRWPHPVILHLNVANGRGHYVVWAPTPGGGDGEIWLGPQEQRTKWEKLWERRSGFALLTSPEPIGDVSQVAEPSRALPVAFQVSGVALFSCGALAALVQGYRRSRSSSVFVSSRRRAPS
jgi:ABC-type bacteriocin/lantibiotic exporter with double-glycine peptidase domain